VSRYQVNSGGTSHGSDAPQALLEDLAILDKVPHRTDRKVDGAVDLGQPGPVVALPATIDDAEKFERSL
jgi:hypothetical protein